MARFRIIVLLCAALLPGAMLSAQAADLGKVLFVRLAGEYQNGASDVYEKDLNTGTIKLLISHKSLPKSFQTRIAAVNSSPNGKYIEIDESPGWVIQNKKTGNSRVVFGYGFSYNVDEKVADEIGGGRWCWERKTGIIKKIRQSSVYEDIDLAWSPNGDYMLLADDTDGYFSPDSAPQGFFQIYNPISDKSYHFTNITHLGIAAWTGKGDGVIQVTYSREGVSTVSIQPIAGKRKLVFTWPRPIASIAQSPDGTKFAIFDTTGYYLTDSKGKNAKILQIPIQKECFIVDLKFNKSGTHLAIVTYYNFGEPHVSETDQLWSVDVKKANVMRITVWNESFQGFGTAINRSVAGWMPDDKSIVIDGCVSYGVEMPADIQKDWRKLWSYSMLIPTGKGDVLFDSGKSCLSTGYCPVK